MPKLPGCPTASGRILQYAYQHAVLALLTQNLWRSETYVTSTGPQRERGQMRAWHMFFLDLCRQ